MITRISRSIYIRPKHYNTRFVEMNPSKSSIHTIYTGDRRSLAQWVDVTRVNGDRVTLARAEIEDWIIQYPDDTHVGYFSQDAVER
jgi:hypothetical protein